MIKIEKKQDLKALYSCSADSLVKRYISDNFNEILYRNHCEDLTELGAFYLLTTTEDLEHHREVGLSKPIVESLPEYTEVITLKNQTREIKLLHSCFVISNSYAISLFAEVSILPKAILDYLCQDSISKTITYNK